jgi:hypothetical protein
MQHSRLIRTHLLYKLAAMKTLRWAGSAPQGGGLLFEAAAKIHRYRLRSNPLSLPRASQDDPAFLA